jgi:hypothetical protein
MDKAFEITTDLLMGKEVSDEDKLWLQKRNAKYEIVRILYMEKMNYMYSADGMQLTNFQFTPGDKFAETPTIDILNDLLKFNETIKRGEFTEIKFQDKRSLSSAD